LAPATVDAFGRGEVVFVSDNFAYRHNAHAGDTLPLETPAGERRFRIAAVLTDYTLDIGTIVINRDTYRELWRDDLVNTFGVWLETAANAEHVRAAISERLASRQRVTILSGREFNGQIAGALDNALLMTYAIQVVAIAIAVIGVLNFFLAEVVDRRREIGLLRGVAFTRAQILQMFSTEALLLGIVGGVLAVLFGWVIARMLVLHSTRLISGWALAFDFPWALAGATVVIAAATAVAAGIYPARRAATERVADLVIAG
jgi:putative ABC transport system permease protein